MAEPEPISIFDLEPDDAFEARLDAEAEAEAEADIAAGRVVPHDKVAIWLDELAQGKRSPPPTA